MFKLIFSAALFLATVSGVGNLQDYDNAKVVVEEKGIFDEFLQKIDDFTQTIEEAKTEEEFKTACLAFKQYAEEFKTKNSDKLNQAIASISEEEKEVFESKIKTAVERLGLTIAKKAMAFKAESTK